MPSHGILSPIKRTPALGGDNTVDYAARPGYIGEDSFMFIVTDGIIEIEAAKVTLQVISRE